MALKRPRIGCLILLIAGMGVLFLFMYGYRALMGTLPSTKGTLPLNGLADEAKIYRDGYSIPYVFARNEHDLFFVQGFVTAQDRLWQMDLLRRTADGRLSEIFGRQSLGTDSLMRWVGIRRAARACAAGLSEKSRSLLGAYAYGVNAFIASHRRHMPVETMLLNYGMVPWTVEDCIAVYRLFAWQSDPGWLTEPLKTVLAGSDKKFRARWENQYIGATGRMGDFSGPAEKLLLFLGRILDERILTKPAAGSFAFAVPGNRTDMGKPVLVHVPCTGLSIPVLWYQIRLQSGNFHVSGLSIPGFPMVVSGFNGRYAWGSADLHADDLGFLPAILRMKNDGKVDCLSGNAWTKAEMLDDTIRITADTTIRMQIPMTERGPVLCCESFRPGVPVRGFVLRWKGLEPADETLALYRLNRSGSPMELEDAFTGCRVPGRIWIFADSSGNVGYWMPSRGSGSPRFEIGGLTASATEGCLAIGKAFLAASGSKPDFRIRRLQALLSQADTVSIIDVKRILTDVVSLYALRFVETVLPQLEKVQWKDSLETESLRILSAWNGEMKPGSAGAAIYETLFERFAFNAFHTSMDERVFALFTDLPSIYLPLAIVAANSRKSDRTLVEKSFRETVERLRKTFGTDASQWNWGTIHTLALNHPLGGRRLLKDLFNAGPFPMGESSTTMNSWEHPIREPFEVKAGPSARLIVDLGNPDNSVSVIGTGQSGQSMDMHYRDQVQLILEGCYHPDLWDEAKIRQSGWSLLVLQPEKQNE